MSTSDSGYERSTLESYDSDGFTEGSTTSVLPGGGSSGSADDSFDRGRTPWHGGADFGLFVLRIVVGGIVGVHGMQVVFGSFHGPGADRFGGTLQGLRYTHTGTLAEVAGWAAIVCGALIVLGLLTSLAASVALALLANAVYVLWSPGLFNGSQVEYPLALAAMAFCVMMSGPGRWALDLGRAWHRRAAVSGFVCLVIAAALTVLPLLFLRTH